MSQEHRETPDADETGPRLRDEYPSGWRVLTQNDSVALVIDALMDDLPGSEHTKTELAEQAEVSRQSVYTHLDLLLALDVLESVEGTSPQRYRAVHDSDLLRLLHRVDGAVNERLTQ